MFSVHLQNQDPEVRKSAFLAYYSQYEKHKHAIAALYTGSVHLDIYRSRVRNYPSSRAAALFPDNVPKEVYDNLIQTALQSSGLKTKKKAIEEGLKLLIQVNRQKQIKRFRGKLRWTGNLEKMRTDK